MDNKELLKIIEEEIENTKLESTKIINISDYSTVTDYQIITTATSTRHAISSAKKIILKLKKLGIKPESDGIEQGDWIVLDCNSIFLHIFLKPIREKYNLESFFQELKNLSIN